MTRAADDDARVSINMRGGPERFTVTGWVQIMDVQKHHEGDYTCRARNEQGQNEATARVKVTDDGMWIMQPYSIIILWL